MSWEHMDVRYDPGAANSRRRHAGLDPVPEIRRFTHVLNKKMPPNPGIAIKSPPPPRGKPKHNPAPAGGRTGNKPGQSKLLHESPNQQRYDQSKKLQKQRQQTRLPIHPHPKRNRSQSTHVG